MLALAGFAVKKARDGVGPQVSAYLATAFNITIPLIIKLMMKIEPHSTEGAYQTSLYLKITLFRWTLSAILPQVSSSTGMTSSD
jgi:hypothetical protein